MGAWDSILKAGSAAKGLALAGKSSYMSEMWAGKAVLGTWAHYKGSMGAGAVVGAASGAIDGMFNSDTSVIGGAFSGAIGGAMVGAAIPAAFHYGAQGLNKAGYFASGKAMAAAAGNMKGVYTDASNAIYHAANFVGKYGNSPRVVQGSIALASLASTGVGARVLNRNKRA